MDAKEKHAVRRVMVVFWLIGTIVLVAGIWVMFGHGAGLIATGAWFVLHAVGLATAMQAEES